MQNRNKIYPANNKKIFSRRDFLKASMIGWSLAILTQIPFPYVDKIIPNVYG
jgi:hypothetical protein